MTPTSTQMTLCLACGLCCNGALNQYTKVLAGEVESLQRLGLTISPDQGGFAFPQPCACLQSDNRCAIYAQRPHACRAYECKLYKKHTAGLIPLEEALATAQKAHTLRTQPEKASHLRAFLQRHFEPAQALRERLRP